MSSSTSPPARTLIKSTLPPMEAPLSARSASWSPCCPPWTSCFAACLCRPSLAARVKPPPPGTWACSRWKPKRRLSGLHNNALPEPGTLANVLMQTDNYCGHLYHYTLCDCKHSLLPLFRIMWPKVQSVCLLFLPEGSFFVCLFFNLTEMI